MKKGSTSLRKRCLSDYDWSVIDYAASTATGMRIR